MPTRAYLYDAMGTDREVTPNPELVESLHDQQLLWVDSSDYDDEEVKRVGKLLALRHETLLKLMQKNPRPRLDNHGAYFQLNIDTIQQTETAGSYERIELHFVIGSNMVLTMHRKPVAFLDSFDSRIQGDSEIGQLDASTFLAALLDWHITSYFRIIEQLEHQVDHIDTRALRLHRHRSLLEDLAQLRQKIALIRRILTPHREVYAAMSRPDFHLLSKGDTAINYRDLNARLERAIEAVENARELLIGSFDIFTTQTTLRTNEAIKALTLISAVLLPASLIVSICSLLLKSPVYNIGQSGFWLMLFGILTASIGFILVARMRRWL